MKKYLNHNQYRISLITCFSAFILGYLNAHGAIFDIGVMVSPQTGNLVNMAISMGSGDVPRIINTTLIFSAFILACFLSAALMGKIESKRNEFLITWSAFFFPILLNWIFIDFLHPRVSMFGFSFISGVALCFFRQIGELDVNNSIVTGNMRFIGNSLFNLLFRKDKSKKIVFQTFVLSTFLFFLGAFVVTLLSSIGRNLAMLVIVVVTVIPYFIGFKIEDEMDLNR